MTIKACARLHVASPPGASLIEGLPSTADAADQRRDTEKQQSGPDDRAGDLRLNDLGMRPGQNKESEHQLGGVPAADVEQAADGAAGALCELFGGTPDPIGEYGDGGRAGKEEPSRRRVNEVAQSKG